MLIKTHTFEPLHPRFMKRFLLISLLFAWRSGSAQTVDSAWVVQNYTKHEWAVPMRDGAKLFTVIYEPVDHVEKHPILLVRTPYSCAPYGEKKFSSRLWSTHWK